MALNFPGLFPSGKEMLVNYDWTDVSLMTGYIVFDGFNAEDSGGNKYTLIESGKSTLMTPSLNNNVLDGSLFTNGSTFDMDFDLTPFKLPVTLGGTALVRICLCFGTSTASAVSVTATLRKWDGSTETQLGTVTSVSEEIASGDERGHILKMTISNTHFKAGEILRLTVTGSGGAAFNIAHNPRDTAVITGVGADFTAGNSRLSVAVPFKIEV